MCMCDEILQSAFYIISHKTGISLSKNKLDPNFASGIEYVTVTCSDVSSF